jgi:hypothetical protein
LGGVFFGWKYFASLRMRCSVMTLPAVNADLGHQRRRDRAARMHIEVAAHDERE